MEVNGGEKQWGFKGEEVRQTKKRKERPSNWEREKQAEGQHYREIMWRETGDRCRDAEMKLSNRKEATKEQEEKMYIETSSNREKWGGCEETVRGKAEWGVMSGLITNESCLSYHHHLFNTAKAVCACPLYVNGPRINLLFFSVKSREEIAY